MACYGGQILPCRACVSDRTPQHDLIDDAVARMHVAHTANMHVAHSARRPRASSLAYSPNWRPDLASLDAARDGNHMIADVMCPSVVTQAAVTVPATSHMPLVAAIAAAAAEKHRKCGNVLPHTMLPIVVEHVGGINKEGMELFRMCRKKALNKLHAKETEASTWSSRGVSNFFLQSLSLASRKGLGHLHKVTVAGLRAA